jgi:hypothetical protein
MRASISRSGTPHSKHLERTSSVLRDLERAASPDEIAHLLVGAFARYGGSYTMAGIVAEPALPARRHAGFVLANTMPEGWGRRSVTQGYARHDPPALHQRDAVRLERRGAGAPGRTDNLETAGGQNSPSARGDRNGSHRGKYLSS